MIQVVESASGKVMAEVERTGAAETDAAVDRARRAYPDWRALASEERAGVLALSREPGVQFARQGVRVNALCPGPVDTPLLRELYAKDPEQATRRLVHVPMGRFAKAREIAQGTLFLASDESSYVTASTFLMDGGLTGAYVTPK